jgi:hypothetical protein
MIVNSRNQNVNETLTKSSDVVKTHEQDHADRIHQKNQVTSKPASRIMRI